ncbi:MAG: hypothetical protein ACLQU3_16080 [Limisphaerales bacterium]
MNQDNWLRSIMLLSVLGLLSGCSSSHPAGSPAQRSGDTGGYQSRLFARYITITPEQIAAAWRAQDSVPAEDDPMGNWGVPRQGLQLSIRLALTDVPPPGLTNSRPIVACITLRNVSEKCNPFLLGEREESSPRIIVMRDGQRILGADDPKPGESFVERLRRTGAGFWKGIDPIPPGTQRQYFRDLSKAFDLTAPGSYSAHAEQRLRDFYHPELETNLVSGTLTFKVLPRSGRN